MTAARTITFTLNGTPVTADVKPHHNLVELLQSQFGLTGARESCGQGLCGCCSVVVNGRAVSGCLSIPPTTKSSTTSPAISAAARPIPR
jgi:carbon-monoxide dehydrogenase small subunit